MSVHFGQAFEDEDELGIASRGAGDPLLGALDGAVGVVVAVVGVVVCVAVLWIVLALSSELEPPQPATNSVRASAANSTKRKAATMSLCRMCELSAGLPATA